MALPVFNFTTGQTAIPDIGRLSYNGCLFSPFFETTISGVAVKDNALRTVKYLEITLTVDGYVTAPENSLPPPEGTGVSPTTATMYTLLTAQGGQLNYQGRGFDLIVNPPGAGAQGAGVEMQAAGNSMRTTTKDLVWGPVPELLEFQPLGGAMSAKVRWQVKVRIANTPAGFLLGKLLQFNYETVVSYGEDGFSSLSVRGTMEIPLARINQASRTLTATVDDMRFQLDNRIFAGIDLSRFRVVRRNYNVSRDKRTLEFDVAVEEKPYMDLPPYCTTARGTYSVKPAKAGLGLCLWLCTLRATYAVRKDMPRRLAWEAFLALLRLRMLQSQKGNIPAMNGNQNAGPLQGFAEGFLRGLGFGPLGGPNLQAQNNAVLQSRNGWLIDFSFDEGLYLDSKTVSFSATWRLTTQFDAILRASGLWTKVAEEDSRRNNLWALSMKNVQGSTSWLTNRLNPNLDVIVDFGS
jgi:hypothetical protein